MVIASLMQMSGLEHLDANQKVKIVSATEATLRFLVQSSSVRIKQLIVLMFSCFDYKGIFAPNLFNAQALEVMFVVAR